jgi:hypothetical protein
VIVQTGTALVSEFEYLMGQKNNKSKIVDVKSEADFPTLDI